MEVRKERQIQNTREKKGEKWKWNRSKQKESRVEEKKREKKKKRTIAKNVRRKII